jgi:hypothetical protein
MQAPCTTPGLGGVARAVQQWVQLLTAAVEVLGPVQVQEFNRDFLEDWLLLG